MHFGAENRHIESDWITGIPGPFRISKDSNPCDQLIEVTLSINAGF
jgi:hypothetical protein